MVGDDVLLFPDDVVLYAYDVLTTLHAGGKASTSLCIGWSHPLYT